MNIITGMHRSGTSLIARLFSEAGADFGDTRTFYPPDQWNPDGYFEQIDIHRINMPLINGPFGKFAYFHLPSTKTISRRSLRFADQIRDTAATFDNCIVKENRFCLTLPAWREHGTSVEKILICLRSPLMVACSLRQRNRIPIRLGFQLWQTHLERLLENSTEIPTHFISYKSLLNEEAYLSEIQSAFSFMGMNHSTSALANICEGRIRFRTNPTQENHSKFPKSARILWTHLCDMHQNQNGLCSTDDLPANSL